MLRPGSQQTNLIGAQLSRRFAIEDNGAKSAGLGFNRQHAEKTQLGLLRGSTAAERSINRIGFDIFEDHWLAPLDHPADHALAPSESMDLGPVLRVELKRCSQLHLLHFRIEKENSGRFKLEDTGDLIDNRLQDYL